MSESGIPPSPPPASPDYAALVRFLVQPFLETPDSLRVDCEISPTRGKVLVRLAFEGTDKGRVFGRGGRNIHAIRTVLTAAAQMAGYSVHLDVFGASPAGGEAEGGEVPRSRSDRPRRSLDRDGDRSDRTSEPASGKPRPRPIPKGVVNPVADSTLPQDGASDHSS